MNTFHIYSETILILVPKWGHLENWKSTGA